MAELVHVGQVRSCGETVVFPYSLRYSTSAKVPVADWEIRAQIKISKGTTKRSCIAGVAERKDRVDRMDRRESKEHKALPGSRHFNFLQTRGTISLNILLQSCACAQRGRGGVHRLCFYGI